jgi:hypothetical protein
MAKERDAGGVVKEETAVKLPTDTNPSIVVGEGEDVTPGFGADGFTLSKFHAGVCVSVPTFREFCSDPFPVTLEIRPPIDLFPLTVPKFAEFAIVMR